MIQTNNKNSNQEIIKHINLFEFICKINSDAKQKEINKRMTDDFREYTENMLKHYGIELDANFYKRELPDWYIALEALVVNIAIATDIFDK